MSPFLKFVLPVLAVATTVLADCDEDFTIKNSGDASSLDCTTFDGTITIDSEAADDLNLDGIEELKGDLILEGNSAIKRLGGSNLQNITGELRISNVQNLVGLDFPKLTAVDKITLNGLPNLRSLGFAASIRNASSLDVQNTKLESLDGINLGTAETIIIANNDGIAQLSMQTTNITSSLSISYNNEDLEVLLPNLKSANNATFRACAKIDLSSLEQINKGSLGILESEQLESFAAPNLTRIDGALTIANNDNLKNISFPLLETVNDNLQIANNTNLNEIDQFPELTTVRGALDLSGNLTKVETPKINLVVGVFNLQSTDNINETCSDFYDPLNEKKKLGPTNKYTCKGELEEANTAGTNSGSSGSGDREGAAPLLSVNSIYLCLVGLAAVFLL